MKISEMSVAYKLQSNNFQLFYDNENSCFIASRNICYTCKELWAHGINQCIFCGSRNYFVLICFNCGRCVSLTRSKKPRECENCKKKETYSKSCFNKDCKSSSNRNLKNIILNTKNSKEVFRNKSYCRRNSS